MPASRREERAGDDRAGCVVAAHGVDGDGEHARVDRGSERSADVDDDAVAGTSRRSRTRCAGAWPTHSAGRGCEEACSAATRSPDGYVSSTSMSSSWERPSFAFLVHVTADPGGLRSDRVRAAGSATRAARAASRYRPVTPTDRVGQVVEQRVASSAAQRGSVTSASQSHARGCGRCRTRAEPGAVGPAERARRRARAAPSRGRAGPGRADRPR